MTAVLLDNPTVLAGRTPDDDDIVLFDDLEAATAEARTGCGDDNPYR